VIAAAVLACALAGCSGGPAATPAASGSGPTTTSPPAAPAPTGLAALPAEDALDAVATALARSGGVSVRGTITSKQEEVSVDVHLARGKGGRGTVSPPDSTLQVIVIGSKVYLTGDKRFLSKAVGPRNVAKFRGKYVAGTTGTALMAEMAAHFNLLEYASMLPTAGLRPEATGKSGGTPTITYAGADGSTLVVADAPDDPVPLRYTGPTTKGPVDLTFGYEQPVKLKAPPKSKLVG
jgi:hypothetical protein